MLVLELLGNISVALVLLLLFVAFTHKLFGILVIQPMAESTTLRRVLGACAPNERIVEVTQELC
jgi:hypothetical protein